MWRVWPSILPVAASDDPVTALKSLALNAVMLAVTLGVLYWVLQGEPEPTPVPMTAVAGPTMKATERPQESEREPSPDDILIPGSRASAPASSVGPGSSRPSGKPAPPPRRPVIFPLDINAAKAEDFMELPGIGEKLAHRIVDYRKSHGKFESVDDLRGVRGIGKKRMEQLRPLVRTATP